MWARASARSIARYAALSHESGIDFYTACGGMMASDEPDYYGAILDTARSEGFDLDVHDQAALSERFAMFRFAPGTVGVWDASGGCIDPRAMRQAHETLARRAGTTVIDDSVTGCNGTELRLASGDSMIAGHVLHATGCYAALSDLLPKRPDMIVCTRTAFFAEVDADQAADLDACPA